MKQKEVLIVGQDPDMNGRAKKILNEALERAGFNPKKLNYVDVLDESLPDGKKITKTVLRDRIPILQKHVKKLHPKLILLLGNTPCEALLGRSGIRNLRGKPILDGDRVVLPVYHPNYALHDDKWIKVIEGDIRRLKDCFDFNGIPEEKELDYTIVDTEKKVQQMLKDLTGTVAVDLETTRLYPFTTMLDELVRTGKASKNEIADHKGTHNGNQPRVVAMQFGCKKRQWVVPMETAGIWDPQRLRWIVKKVTKALKKCITVFHNGKFDCLWMKVRFGVNWLVDFDTMLAHFMLDENDQHGLKYLAQKELGVPDWDVEGDVKTSWSRSNAKYAASDVFYTRKLKFVFAKKLKEDYEVNRVFKYIMMPCVKMFTDAEYQGVFINLKQMDDAEAYLREELAKAQENLSPWAAKAKKVDAKTGVLNWGSSQQLADLLFNVLKIPSIEKTKGGKSESTSESVLLRIDHPLVGDLLKFRAATKQLSGFIEGWKPYLDITGRLHPVFKLHGTVTGRLSCEHPNLQQVPRDPRIRTLITAPDGWTLVEMDLSQIELRIAAELADEHNLLGVFNAGGDPHWQTAIREIERGGGYKKEIKKTVKLHRAQEGKKKKKMSYSEAVEYILAMGGDHAAKLMVMWKETRKKAKAINFGYLYGMWWKKFKLYARDNYGVDVTDKEAEASRDAFFELYPNFPKWHTRQKRFSQLHGYVRSLSGRKRRLPHAMSGRDSPQRREAQRQAINSPVQSFANELNLMAALEMCKYFPKKGFRLVGTVHDAVLLEVRNDYIKAVHDNGLRIMSGPELLQKFEIDLKVPIEADAGIGPWGKGISYEEWQATYGKGIKQKEIKPRAFA
jgi:DNA polymerase I - 3''-5'' exonuclease and polymerase domains